MINKTEKDLTYKVISVFWYPMVFVYLSICLSICSVDFAYYRDSCFYVIFTTISFLIHIEVVADDEVLFRTPVKALQLNYKTSILAKNYSQCFITT